jgi:hypothetical protein
MTRMLAITLALAVAACTIAGWLIYQVRRLQELVEELQTRLAATERQPSREDSAARIRELLGSRSWAPPQAERAEAEPTFPQADADNPTDPGLRALVAR